MLQHRLYLDSFFTCDKNTTLFLWFSKRYKWSRGPVEKHIMHIFQTSSKAVNLYRRSISIDQ